MEAVGSGGIWWSCPPDTCACQAAGMASARAAALSRDLDQIFARVARADRRVMDVAPGMEG